MCFAIPKQIKQIKGNIAFMEDKSSAKLGDIQASPGDFLLVYGNIAVEKIDAQKAHATRTLIKKIDANSDQ